MTFDVEINGKTRDVAIDRVGPPLADGGRFRVTVDGKPVDVDVRRTDIGLSLVFVADGRTVDVGVSDRPGGEWIVDLPRVAITATIGGRRHGGGLDGAARTGEQRVLAPMPGRVVRVLVKAGDDVALRQGLVVVEAMKMENELRAPKAGRIREVSVIEGASVEAGRLLVVIE